MYLAGFGNHHATEAIPGALPAAQNSPQHCPLNLYAEQLSGSAFTVQRQKNLHSWLYRTLPSVVQQDYIPYTEAYKHPFAALQAPNPMRWSPRDRPEHQQDFIDGLCHIAGTSLLNTYIYQCNESMDARYFSNYDAEMLFVPYEGTIRMHTEFGLLEIGPGMIAVIPRGVKFKVSLVDTYAAGYLLENAGAPLRLPELGIIGANGLANPRHFLYPKAAVEETTGPVNLICKSQQHWWIAGSNHSPLNVLAWHGNYAPYQYDLSLFNTLNSVSFDHPDPSIFTVLSSQSDTPDVANLDFVIFPSRWMVAEHTFRPPYFHRNIMNEFMGLVRGIYDAKNDGFSVGGMSIHNCMTAHGPDTSTYQNAIKKTLKPDYYPNTLAFMFESKDPWMVTELALNDPTLQTHYSACWQGLARADEEPA